MQSVGLFFKFSPERPHAFERSTEYICEKIPISVNENKNHCVRQGGLKIERRTAFNNSDELYELDCLDRTDNNEDNR